MVAALIAALVSLSGPAAAQTQPAAPPAAGPSLDVPKLLAVGGGAVLGVVFFNMLSGNMLAARVLEDLGRGVAMVGAAALGGAGGHYVFANWEDLTALR